MVAVGLMAADMASDAFAQRARELPKYDMSGQPYRGGSGRAYGQHDNAIRRTYDYDFHPNARSRSSSSRAHRIPGPVGGHHHHHHHRRRHHHHHHYYPSYGYNYGYYYDYPAYGYYDYYAPLYLPPVTLPAETLFGPRAVQEFLGVNEVLNAHRVGRAEILADQHPDMVLRNDALVARERPMANAEAMARAQRFIDFGDAKFAEGQYHAALQRYKDAAIAAPLWGEVYFRQGHALTVLGRYDQAATAYRRGMRNQPDWPQSDFNLLELFGGNRAALLASRERLAEAAADAPDDADMLFLLGVQIYFSGERERAQPFFREALELAQDRAHIEPFLVAPAIAADGGPREF